MDQLNLPAYDALLRGDGDRAMIFDPVRKKYVRLTPEEWVRQHFIHYLVVHRGVPEGLIAVEAAFTFQGMTRRADIIVHDRRARPLLLVECKAPGIEMAQHVVDQAARYNKVVRARYIVVTNGLVHYCARLDFENHTYEFLDALPAYDEL